MLPAVDAPSVRAHVRVRRNRITSAAPGQAADLVRPAPAPEEPAPSRAAIAVTVASLIVCAVALPVVLAFGGPLNGWVLGTGLWLANWSVQLFTAKHALRMGQTAAVGVTGISFVIRAWTIAGILFITALKFSEEVALIAGIIFIVAFTADLIGRGMAFALRERDRETAATEAAE